MRHENNLNMKDSSTFSVGSKANSDKAGRQKVQEKNQKQTGPIACSLAKDNQSSAK